MKEYTITLTETDVERCIIALGFRERYFRLKAIEVRGTGLVEVYNAVADEYKGLCDKFKLLSPIR